MSQYVPGLEGVPAVESAISTIDVENRRVVVRGYTLEKLAVEKTYEEVAYLLIYGWLPDRDELKAFRRNLVENRHIPSGIIEMLRHLPTNTHPIDAVRTSVSALAPYDPDLEDTSVEANRRKGVRIVAKTGMLTANADNLLISRSWTYPSESDTHAEAILKLLTGRKYDEWMARAFETIFILYIEHELAASTFSARVISSTLTDMYGAVVGAISALKGPLHGGANEKAVELFEVDNPVQYVRDKLARRERVMGFGHRVYRHGIDPRAEVVRNLLEEACRRVGEDRIYRTAVSIERLMAEEKNLYPNLDFHVAAFYKLMGLKPRVYTPIFLASRVAGWAAHVIEQQAENRLFRPRAVYKGPL